ncbi:cation transporter [Streptomyces sp. NPDC005931]|uniref:cation transporter n=1 Tax=Streptomyces sp. NPDC005931 TaxID=3364737 RepID=UPI0036757995
MSGCCTPEGSCHTPARTTTVYRADGIASAHCQDVVARAVAALDGVVAVEVEVGSGLVTVTTDGEPDEALDALIAQTVDEAGYDFAGRVPA